MKKEEIARSYKLKIKSKLLCSKDIQKITGKLLNKWQLSNKLLLRVYFLATQNIFQ